MQSLELKKRGNQLAIAEAQDLLHGQLNFFHNLTDREDERKYQVRIDRKLTHTDGVVDAALHIFEAENLQEKFRYEVAVVATTLHDMARFVQMGLWKTFTDKDSINHAHYATEIIQNALALDEGLFESLTLGEVTAILSAIYHHSDRQLPPSMTNDYLAKLVRDADKTQIFKEDMETDGQIIFTTTPLGPVSTEVLEIFLTGQPLPSPLMKTKSERFLQRLANIFDINYRSALDLILERGTVDWLIQKVEESGEQRPEVLQQIRARMEVFCSQLS